MLILGRGEWDWELGVLFFSPQCKMRMLSVLRTSSRKYCHGTVSAQGLSLCCFVSRIFRGHCGVHCTYSEPVEWTMDKPDKTTCFQSQLYWLSFVFPWELTFHGRYKPHCSSPVKKYQLLRGTSVGLTLHCILCPVSAELQCIQLAVHSWC